jgi:hypothetical protein
MNPRERVACYARDRRRGRLWLHPLLWSETIAPSMETTRAESAQDAATAPPVQTPATAGPLPQVGALAVLPAAARAQAALRVQQTAGNRALGAALARTVLAREPAPATKHKDAVLKDITGQAFVKGAGEAIDISPDDVKQGSLGDCNVLAPAAAVARANPEAIRKLVTAKDDGTYDVSLYYKDHFYSDQTAHAYNLTSKFYVKDDGTPLYAKTGSAGATNELWVMLIEKAFAKWKGGYESASGALWDREGLEMLTGNAAVEAKVSAGTEDDLLTAIDDALKAGDALTVNTSTSKWTDWWRNKDEQAEIDRNKIVMGHAYSIEGVDKSAKTVNLRNPWGYNHLRTLPVATFRKYFNSWSHVKAK